MKKKKLKFRRVKQSLLLRDRIFEVLKDAIFSGELAPGSSLLAAQLAQEFGVSQTTVREALSQLERIHLVDHVAHKGRSVIRLSRLEIAQRMAVRVPLEQLAFVSAAQHVTEKDFEELERRLKSLTGIVQAGDFSRFTHADMEFHNYIWQLSGNQVLAEMLYQLTVPLSSYASVVHGAEFMENAGNSHRQLISVLRESDSKVIQRRLREIFGESGWKEYEVTETPVTQNVADPPSEPAIE